MPRRTLAAAPAPAALLALIPLIALLAPAACGGEPASEATDDAEIRSASIAVEGRFVLPLREVSGLGRRTTGGRAQYLAIGDADQTVVTFGMSGARATSITAHDVSAAVGRSGQWEAVAGDSTGRVFILEEEGNRILVLDEELRSKIHTIELEPGFRDAKSGGEGMLLLANGHVLLAKEKDPPMLVELAPEGAEAEGFRAELALRGDRAFPLPRGRTSRLEAVHQWTLGDAEAAWIGDISDLAVDEEGRVLLLTDQGRAIVRIERTLAPSESRIDAKRIFSLPREVDKPEGLVLADNGRPLVAIDAKSASIESLFVFDRLP